MGKSRLASTSTFDTSREHPAPMLTQLANAHRQQSGSQYPSRLRRLSVLAAGALWATGGLTACSGDTAENDPVAASSAATPLPPGVAPPPGAPGAAPPQDGIIIDDGLDTPAPPVVASNCTPAGPDGDADGFTIEQGDCNDCDANANPRALDLPNNLVDEDCSGVADDFVLECDADVLDIASTDPLAAARSLGLCTSTTLEGPGWGVISARYTKPDGTEVPNPLSHGLLQKFGDHIVPRRGANMLALSSGTARGPNDPGWVSPGGAIMNVSGMAPPGFPDVSQRCPDIMPESNIFDPIALEVEIRVPSNAQSFSFDFNFHTFEFPEYVCNAYNDFFVALQDPPPAAARQGNISFDIDGNSVSVNNALVQVCKPQSVMTAGGGELPFDCVRGPTELEGTGFEVARVGGLSGEDQPHAATGWLTTTSQVVPGSIIKLRFAIWDAGDAQLDSLVLIDNFTFAAEPATDVETKPVPLPPVTPAK